LGVALIGSLYFAVSIRPALAGLVAIELLLLACIVMAFNLPSHLFDAD
jgi:hypothetical protein